MSQHNRVLWSESLTEPLIGDIPGKPSKLGKQHSQDGLAPMRASVLHNLGSLFNAMCHATGGGLDAYPEVRRSVLNYGLATLIGRAATGLNTRALERQVRQAILYFEPRLRPDTVRVSGIGHYKDGHKVMAFRISAQLVVQGGPVRMCVITRLEPGNGVSMA